MKKNYFIICLLVFFAATCAAQTIDIQQLTKKAQQGDASAQNNLASAYFTGNGVSKDATKAVYWFRKAAEKGNIAAQSNLAYCYQEGVGIGKDLKQAFVWQKKAAEQGDLMSQNDLGFYYEYGFGVAVDLEQAEVWYRKAANQGYAQAKKNLESLLNSKESDAHAFGLKGKVKDCMWLKGARGKYYLKPFGYTLRFDETGKITWADAIIKRDKNGRIEKMTEKNGRNEILFNYDSDGLVSRFYFGPKTKDTGEALLMTTIYEFEYDNRGNVITVKEFDSVSELSGDKPSEVVKIKYTEFDEKGNWKKREYECKDFDNSSMSMKMVKFNESRIIHYYY